MIAWIRYPGVALRSLLKNKSRSLLTSLGIIIGVGSVIVMVSVGQGSQADIAETINSMGVNMLMVMPPHSMRGGVNRGAGSLATFTMDDADYLRERSEYCSAISAMTMSPAQVIGGEGNWSTSVLGVDVDYPRIRDWGVDQGEFFTARDVRTRSKVALIGKTIADELFPGQNPVGVRVRVRNTPFTIIGVLSEKGEDARGRDQDDVILAPVTTVLARLKGGREIDMIQASARTIEELDEAEEEVADLLRTLHKIMPGEDDDFHVRTQTEIIERASETSRIMTSMLGAVAAVSLIVGGIGIMNIMLVSVTERTREIGIRMAVGARERDILLQFMLEAVSLSLAGGVIGVMVALLVAAALDAIWGVTTVVNPMVVLMAFGFAGIVGVFFGIYPARKAASLNPIDALRHE
ncbi:MAG: ABC transporter permease [Candidatus Eisenbacteria bacterium]|jgi:putative ABC transport system permease protein|nr:ABC transporter permease [Candidatus Eisenbacteria bacterium]